MKFAIVVYENAREFEVRNDPLLAPAYWGAYAAYAKAMTEAGVAAGGAGLQPPSTATAVRVRDGKHRVQDGPFADAKEQLGGFFLIDVPDLDTALKWAARCPAASTCGVEVRPVLAPIPG